MKAKAKPNTKVKVNDQPNPKPKPKHAPTTVNTVESDLISDHLSIAMLTALVSHHGQYPGACLYMCIGVLITNPSITFSWPLHRLH
jgi:hypothetical protein